MPILERIRSHFTDSIQTNIQAADTLLSIISYASQKIAHCLLEGHKILCCGNGGSAAQAQQFASNMINHLKHERPSLPAFTLNADLTNLAIAAVEQYEDMFAKQIRALGLPGDLLMVITTDPHAANLINAIKAAQDRQLNILALTGHDGGKITSLLSEHDVEVRVPSEESCRIQETHLLIIHSLCDIVDYQLFGHGDVLT